MHDTTVNYDISVKCISKPYTVTALPECHKRLISVLSENMDSSVASLSACTLSAHLLLLLSLSSDAARSYNSICYWTSSMATADWATSPEITHGLFAKAKAHPVGGKTHRTASVLPPGGRLRSRPSPAEPGRLGSGWPVGRGKQVEPQMLLHKNKFFKNILIITILPSLKHCCTLVTLSL